MHALLNELAPNIFWMAPDHRTDRPVVAAIAGRSATLMVDAGSSVRHANEFLSALEEKNVAPVRHVVLTHSHWDHVFGAPAFDAEVISTEQTQRHLETMATYAWNDAALDERVADGREIAFCRDMIKAELDATARDTMTVRVPDRSFQQELTIDLGDLSVQLLQVGGDHAPDSCIVVVPGVVAFLSDCVCYNLHVEPNYYTRTTLFPLLDRMLDLDVAHFVLGHDDAPLSRAAFEEMASQLRAIGEAVQTFQSDDVAIESALEASSMIDDITEVRASIKKFQAGLGVCVAEPTQPPESRK